MKKRFTSLLVMLLVLSLLVVGCGQGKEPEEDVEEVEEEVEETAEYDFEGRTLNVVTTSEKYQELFDAFGEEVNADVAFLSMSSGEVIARVKSEGGTPMADLWFGGGIDAFMAAKDDDLLEPYTSEMVEKIDPRFRDEDGYWLSKGITVVGFLANDEILEEKGLEIPRTWKELADPKYADEVIMSSPAISGTNYAALKGFLDMFGEEEGWDFVEKLNSNIPFYGKRGKDPQEKTVAGEFGLGIIPADKSAFDAAEENDLTVIYPEDGIPWVPEGVAIFKNSENADIAKAFIDFMLREENQNKLAELDGKDGAQMVVEGIDGYDLGLPEDKLADMKLEDFGERREEILEKWEAIAGDKQGE